MPQCGSAGSVPTIEEVLAYTPSCSLTWLSLHQVEPNTKLFPAVFVLPTHQNVIQFELGKQKVRVRCWESGTGRSSWK